MNIRWVQSPCKDCPERQIKCHASCERFKEYQEKHNAERKRMYEEDCLRNQVNNLNYGSFRKKENNKGAMKHGYKPKRR